MSPMFLPLLKLECGRKGAQGVSLLLRSLLIILMPSPGTHGGVRLPCATENLPSPPYKYQNQAARAIEGSIFTGDINSNLARKGS